MHRLFVALRPPPEIRKALTGLMGGIEGARWQNDNQLHITLAFIGEVDRHTAEAVAEALETIRQPALNLKLGQFGTFDTGRPDRTGTLWIGVEDGPDPRHPAQTRRPGLDPVPLAALAQSVRQTLRRAGTHPDPRKFTPHITLARFGQSGAPREAFRPWLTHSPAPQAAWQSTEFHLMESTLGREGAHHTPVATYPLG